MVQQNQEKVMEEARALHKPAAREGLNSHSNCVFFVFSSKFAAK